MILTNILTPFPFEYYKEFVAKARPGWGIIFRNKFFIIFGGKRIEMLVEN